MAAAAASHRSQDIAQQSPLFLAFELGANTWKLGLTTGAAQRARERQMPAGDVKALCEEITRAKQRFHLPEDTPVISCDEAGRDGLWLHRFFASQGVDNRGVDAASIAVNRRYRRAKTDRLEAHKWLTMLRRHVAGARKVWSVVRVPSVVEEDRRQLHRELLTAKRDRTRVLNRIQGVFAGSGVRLALHGDVVAQREQGRQWDGTSLPAALQARLQREGQKVQRLTDQIGRLAAERREEVRTSAEPVVDKGRQLTTLRGVGLHSAWLFVMEGFAWRDFQTPKQLGAFAGRTPTPYQSGEASRKLGMAKAGNGYRRTMAVEMAWGWVRFQPTSMLILRRGWPPRGFTGAESAWRIGGLILRGQHGETVVRGR